MFIKIANVVVLATVVVGLAGPGSAQEEVLMSDDPSYCEVFGTLSGIDKEACELSRVEPGAGTIAIEGDTQGLALGGQSATQADGAQDSAGGTANPPTNSATAEASPGVATAPPRTATFPSIQFEFNSADLAPAARQTLDTVAAVLKDPYFGSARFIIEGHTDAVGNADYNQALSERRARSVVNYLTAQWGIAGNRFTPRGRGETELYDPSNPESGINRRVSVLVTGG